ncbi:MAG: Ni/Fe hydrogenase subunit alpha [candidate division WOR-3 bacterium]
MKKISIDPITRLEGHGKIEIFLEKGKVKDVFLQVPEFRGFEKFCEGRKGEDMPQLTSRICGVCPVAHHFAATKALDSAYNCEVPIKAKKLRELMYCGYIIYDHILHFYFLGGPDFLVGKDAPKEKRNIIGVIEKYGEQVGMEVIKHRAYGQKITEVIGGKATHPVCGIPGGVTKGISEEERKEIEEMAKSCVQFSLFTLEIFKKNILENYQDLFFNKNFDLELYNMGLVDDDKCLNFYDGKVRVTAPDNSEYALFEPKEYLNYIGEYVYEWSFVKFPYLKNIGFKGLIPLKDNGLYRVGPLARLNVSESLKTKEAQKEFENFYKTYNKKPVNNIFAYHWARLIELLYASERALELSSDKDIIGYEEIRNFDLKKPKDGVGIVEAARGTLIHHYFLNEEGMIEKVNLIVATTNNNGALNISLKIGALSVEEYLDKEDEKLLNQIEMFFRAYDPCLACASHNLKFQILKKEENKITIIF